MKPLETEIVKLIEDRARELVIVSELNKLIASPLGEASPEFITHPAVIKFIDEARVIHPSFLAINLWFCIESYLSTKNDLEVAKVKLQQVEEILIKCIGTSAEKERGMWLLPREIANEVFIRSLYLLNDENLNALCLKYLPMPRAKVFKGYPIPKIIVECEQALAQTMQKMLGSDVAVVERGVMLMQRHFRATQRKKEDIKRVSFWQKLSLEETQRLLKEANTPYIPQCNASLAKRIMAAAKKEKLFATVKHLTAASSLPSIIDEGLFGRRTILQSYLPFMPSALQDFDIAEGDGNVICMGANEVDSTAAQSVKLEFDVARLASDNSGCFFKQRDLGFEKKKIRKVKVGNYELAFSHTHSPSVIDERFCPFTVFEKTQDDSYRPVAKSKIRNTLLVSYNVGEMHQILMLNFFRFIDELDSKGIREKIYAELSKLDDKTLSEALKSVGMKLTDTMEFNIYGAYKIDFSALLQISKGRHTFNLPALINEINLGKTEMLQALQQEIPEIFGSHRFVDYLLNSVRSEHRELINAVMQHQRDFDSTAQDRRSGPSK